MPALLATQIAACCCLTPTGHPSAILTRGGTLTGGELDVWKALLLGLVEGITEYLPVSSTGHLLVTSRLLGIAESRAADAYTIVIQAGAIAAVLLLYRRRIGSMLSGMVGRNPAGRHLLAVLVVAFLPAAVLGFAFSDAIKNVLFEVVPIALAWIVGGLVILAFTRWSRTGERALEQLTIRDGLVIGFAQALALWPGTSRSLVAILGGLLIGLSISAAVEFSFLLGLVTLSAATGFEAVQSGGIILDTFGVAAPVVGFVAAAVSAAVAVRWLVAYLERRGLAVFGWYRIAVGVAVLGLVVAEIL